MKTYKVRGDVNVSVVAESREKATVIAQRQFRESGLHVMISHIEIEPVAPEVWMPGQLVEYINSKEWAWSTGTLGRVHIVDTPSRPGYKYQVFWVNPLNREGHPDKGYLWWTTPQDVRYIEEDVDA